VSRFFILFVQVSAGASEDLFDRLLYIALCIQKDFLDFVCVKVARFF